MPGEGRCFASWRILPRGKLCLRGAAARAAISAACGGIRPLRSRGRVNGAFRAPAGHASGGGSAPAPRVTFVRTKVIKKRRGDPGPPFFCLIGLGMICGSAAAESLPGRWPLVIGAVRHALRLTALVLIVVSDFLSARPLVLGGFCRFLLTGAGAVPTAAGSPAREKEIRFSLQKAVRRSPTSSPPQIGSPEDFLIQWLRTGPI